MLTAISGAFAVVTGAGSGLGRDISLGLAAKGYRVFGTSRNQNDIGELFRMSNERVALTLVDITDQAAVRRWADDVATETGNKLDLLVNNAGILTPGPLEVLSLDAVRDEFEVNTFAPLTVINAFLPALRISRGRIVQISTGTASMPLPFNGPSGASKAALEAFSKVYRAELKPFGVDVVIVEPGNMRTGGPAKSAAALARMSESMTPEQRDLYGKAFDTMADAFNAGQSSGMDSEAAAQEIIALAEETPAPSFATVGADSEEWLRVARDAPFSEQDAFRLRLVGLE
jgi:NAD(P)-dependent dehydrogenase (short-subunit alcohol dehydrogenase family)